MQVLETVAAIRAWRASLTRSVGFVPTMGYLHDGHLALASRAMSENDDAVVSIFVNPAQFAPGEDFAAYPRDLDRDLALLERQGIDVAFVPSAAEMYPPGFGTSIDVGDIATRLEGASRSGHFRGVATVVARLLILVRPDRAYFGWKDAQQVLVVRRMVTDLSLPVEIVPVETVREPDGLAMSSRNVYLSPDERRAATALSHGLFAAQEQFEAGERDAARLRAIVEDHLRRERLVQSEYVSLADLDTLQELTTVDRPAVLSLAARVGKTRLIDSMRLIPDG